MKIIAVLEQAFLLFQVMEYLSQGMSIGVNELITHAVIRLNHNITMEAKSLRKQKRYILSRYFLL